MASLLDLLPFVLAGGIVTRANGDRVALYSSVDPKGVFADCVGRFTGSPGEPEFAIDYLRPKDFADDTWRRVVPSGLTFARAMDRIRSTGGRVMRRGGGGGRVMSLNAMGDLVVTLADGRDAGLRVDDIGADDWEVIDD